MIRTRTTLVVGPGAGAEIELPDPREVLARTVQGYDLSRLGTDLQTRDMVVLSRHFEALAGRLGAEPGQLPQAAAAIRTAARVSLSLEAIVDQQGHDPLVEAAARLALVHYTLQAEARSPLAAEPRDPGDLPLRGAENWLFQLGRMIVSGVARAKAENAFDNLSIVSFAIDRSVEHYLPFVFQMAFGMSLAEARALVAARLKIVHPLGTVGRLAWQSGDAPAAGWGEEEPRNILELMREIRSPAQVAAQPRLAKAVQAEVAGARRLVFLGFGFDPALASLLTDHGHLHGMDAEVLVALTGLPDSVRQASVRAMRRQFGGERGGAVQVEDMRPYQLLRDYAVVLES